MSRKTEESSETLWNRLKQELKRPTILFAAGKFDSEMDLEGLKVILASSDLREALGQVRETTRDQVVMVRLDEATSKALDDWVEVGAVKSRSEAAALFIFEGLKMRSDELEQLRSALQDVEKAKARLRRKASEVFDGASR